MIVDVIVFVTNFFAITKKVVPTSGLISENCAKIRVSVSLEQFILDKLRNKGGSCVFNEVVHI